VARGFVFPTALGRVAFAIGPMGTTTTGFPVTSCGGSPLVRERHGPALAPSATTWSCIAFPTVGGVRGVVGSDIVEQGTPVTHAMLGRRPRPTPAGGDPFEVPGRASVRT